MPTLRENQRGRNALLLVLAVVALVAGASWWTLRGGGESPRGGALDSRRVDESTQLADADAAVAAVQPSRTDAARSETDLAPASDAVKIDPWPVRGLRLLIVDRDTGAPQPGAIVTRVDPFWNPDVISGDALDVLRRLDRWGRRYRADEKGMVRVPSSSTALEIYARSEKRLGERWVQPYEAAESEAGEPVRIEVAPMRTLRVQTVDALGVPRSGFPVCIVSDMSERSIGHGVVISRAPDGIVEIRGADLLFDDGAWPPGLEIGLNLAQIEPQTIRVTREQLDGPPVRLVVPDTGRVEARLVDRERRTVERDAEVYVSLSRPVIDEATGMPSEEREGLDVTRAKFVAGIATIEPVALGLVVEFDDRLEEWGSAAGTAPGPTRAGETTQLVLTVGEAPILFTGALVDRWGSPIASRPFEATFAFRRDGSSSGEIAGTSTADDGSFRLFLRHFVRGAWNSGEVEFVVRHDRGGVDWKGKATVRSEVAASGGSLGQIELADYGHVVSGIVVDDSGQPIARAIVWLVERDADPEDGTGPTKDLWARTDEDGRFEIHGDPGDAELALAASASTMRVPSVPIVRGATDARIVVPRYGALVARIVLEPELPRDVVEANLVVTEEREGAAISTRGAHPDRRGEIAWNSLPPGLARVSILPGRRCFGERPQSLLEVAGIRIESGQRAKDPRLDPIDLRGRFRSTRLSVVDSDGRAVGNGEVVQVVDGRAEGMQIDLERGEAQICALAAWPEVEVQVPGFRSTRAQLVAPETRVVLRPRPLVHLRLALTGTPLLPDIALSHTLVRVVSDETEWVDSDFQDLVQPKSGGPMIARLPMPGRYSLQCSVRRQGGRNSSVVDAERTALIIDVADVDEPQSFDVELSTEAILAAAQLLSQE